MTFKWIAAVAVAGVVGSGAAGMAQDLVSVDQIGAWEVLVDPTIGNGCLIAASFEDGSDVRIGFDVTAGTAYMMAMNAAWGGIVEGDSYPIAFDLDGTVYDGEAIGIVQDDLPGVDIPFDSVDFLMDVATKQTMTLLNADGPVMQIDLSDSAAALSRALDCQEQQG